MEKKASAFTLIELLVVIGIVGILASLFLAGRAKSRSAMQRTVAVANMRQIGTAILQYATDHDGTLPGTLQPGQTAIYNPAAPSQLATLLGPYLGISDPNKPKPIKVFLPPACVKALPKVAVPNIRPFVMNTAITIDGTLVYPWGNSAPLSDPMKIASFGAGQWGFTDADQANPLVKGQPWAAFTPTTQVHTPTRIAWFFDGSVQPIPSSALIPPPQTSPGARPPVGPSASAR